MHNRACSWHALLWVVLILISYQLTTTPCHLRLSVPLTPLHPPHPNTQMKNHVSCLQSRANQLQREQELVQQQLAVFEGLLCARSTWRQVVEGLLDSSWEADELIVEQEDRELQALLDEQPQNPEHVLEQLPLLGALRRIDR